MGEGAGLDSGRGRVRGVHARVRALCGAQTVGLVRAVLVSALLSLSLASAAGAQPAGLSQSPLAAGAELAPGTVASQITPSQTSKSPSSSAPATRTRGQKIAPYSPHPSETEPHYVCPPPTTKRASCAAIGVPTPTELRSLHLAVPSFEGSGESGGFSPADLRSAYKLPAEGGEGKTVAITDAYDDPNAESDLAVYRAKYGLPACTAAEGCFEKVNQKGEAKNYPEAESGWAEEISIDLDMVSAVCPKCHILLVEANDAEFEDLLSTVETAAHKGAEVISDSWDGEEFSGESSFDHYVNQPGIPVLFGSGDSGYGVEWPASSPDVVAVGGTSLKKKPGTERGWSETAWVKAGSGCSAYEKKPVWQKDEGCTNRTTADVSAVADQETPVSVYDSYHSSGWRLFGGTSVATPIVAGVEALSSSAFRAAGPHAFYDAGQGGGLFDVTEGDDGYCDTYLCEAEPGYDGPTGWGTPDGPQALPVALTEAAKTLSSSSVTLHGTVDPEGHETKYRFEYGTTTSYGTTVPSPEGNAGSGGEYGEVSQAVEGLKGQTLYHYRIVATNSKGTFYGVDRTFATTSPTVVTGVAGEVHANDAILHATVNPEGTATKYYFEFGTGTTYGRVGPLTAASAGSGTSAGEVSATVGGLTGGRTYHFRVAARNAGGVTYGKDQTFTTEPAQWVALGLPLQPPDPLPGPRPYENDLNDVSCVSQSFCMAVGDYFSDYEQLKSQVWNGTGWTAHSLATPTEVSEIIILNVSCAAENWCVAVGYYSATKGTPWRALVEQWNGVRWTVGTVHPPEGAKSVFMNGISCASSEACVAVGRFEPSGGGPTKALAFRWNGTEWTNLEVPGPKSSNGVSELIAVSCSSPSWCMAVGEYRDSSGIEQPFAEVWSNGSWTIVQESIAEGYRSLVGVSCSSLEECTVLIHHHERGSTLGVERWVSSEWRQETLSKPVGAEEVELTGISCPAAKVCTVVGNSYIADGGYMPVAYGFTGGTWRVLSTTEPAQEEEGALSTHSDSFLVGVSCSSSSVCAAVGASPVQGGQLRGMAEFYDAAPGTATEAASGVTRSEGTPNGTVDPNGVDTAYYFEYGLTTSYGHKTGEMDAGSGTSSVKASAAKSAEFEGEDACTSPTSCEAVGYYNTNTGVYAPMAEHWNGTGWSLQSVPMPASAKEALLYSVACSGALDCEAAGRYVLSSGVRRALAERWNGARWEVQTAPSPEGSEEVTLDSVSCASESICEAVGSYVNGTHTRVALAERWNGWEWTIQATPNPEGAGETWLEGVSCTVNGTECMASGYYKNSAGVRVTLAEYWNGTEWVIQSTPNPSGAKSSQLEGVSCTTSSCIATGYYENSSGVTMTLAEYWSVSTKTWETQSTANQAEAKENHLYGVSCSSATTCTATGYSVSSSGVKSPLAERWTGGTEWVIQATALPEGARGGVLSGVSCVSSTFCMATDEYENGAGFRSTLAESWNGSKWEVQATPYPGAPIAGLSPGTTYHFRIVAVNALGQSTDGADSTFTTASSILLPTPNPKEAQESKLLATSCPSSSTMCMSVGEYDSTKGGSAPVAFAEQRSSFGWSVQSVPTPEGAKRSSLHGVSCPTTTTCLAVGGYQTSSGSQESLAETWKGSKWEVLSTPNPVGGSEVSLYAISCANRRMCYAVGSYYNGAGEETGLIEFWNGGEWAIQPIQQTAEMKKTDLLGVSCPSTGLCNAIGDYQNSAGENLPLAEGWTGESNEWKVQSAIKPKLAKETVLEAVSCASTSECTATGHYVNGAGELISLAERWTGTGWSTKSTPNLEGGVDDFLDAVSCTAANACVATGYVWTSTWVTLAEEWEGSSWKILSTPNPEGAKHSYLRAVSCTTSTSCLAVGYYESSSGEVETLAEEN